MATAAARPRAAPAPAHRQAWARALRRLGSPLGAALWGLLLVAHLAGQAWDEQALQRGAQRLGPAATAALPALRALLAQGQAVPDAQRLPLVNQFFNLRVEFRTDAEVWGVDDHWTTPLEMLGAGRGDCEDYVIAKYVSLLAMGVSRERLRLVYVRARLPDSPEPQAHMVLAYYADPEAEPLVLDNLRGEVLPASRRGDLTPVFSFNSDGLWQGVGRTSAGDPMARLSRWRQTWQRILQEGWQ